MPSLFSRLKGKDGSSKSKKQAHLNGLADNLPAKPQWEDGWARTTVEAEEVQELIRYCTVELKARALDLPFLLLPYRPTSNPSAVRTFVRNFFHSHQTMRGERLIQELRMTEPMVVSGVIKWCWSRLSGGVVGWDSYELFKVGEQDSNMASDSFKTFIPLSVDSEAKAAIIFDFFELLAAVAAHGKTNGFGGRKLSRMASWWAFEHPETGTGFEGGYRDWLKSADATSHLFFAHLRSMAPQQKLGGPSLLPVSLQKLLQETEYPPQRPSLMQSTTNKVVMIVDTVSPTPFALLRRANHFQYRDEDQALRQYSEYDDPIQALTEECRRVLKSISAANQSQAVSSSKHSTSLRDASWSRFEDIGFSSSLEEEEEDQDSNAGLRQQGLRSTPRSGNNLGRPTTPSWADFLSSGFVADGPNSPTSLLLPPDKVLPPIDTQVRQRSAQSHRPRLESDIHLEPGELASINKFELDDSFWWVWMSSLAPEETAQRKSAFGRCAVIETVIRSGRWLVMEEMVKGAAPEPEAGAYIAEKKSLFGWTRRNKTGVSRSKSTTGKHALDRRDNNFKSNGSLAMSKTSIGPDQQAKIQAAAQQLQARQMQERHFAQQQSLPMRRGRTDADLMAEKTTSVFTLQSAIVSEASPAVKWANRYDKDAVREAYLGNNNAGRGLAALTAQANGLSPHAEDPERGPDVPEKRLSPGNFQSSTSHLPSRGETPEPPRQAQYEIPDKEVAVVTEPHPVERYQEPTGRVSPMPPAQQSAEYNRQDMISPEPEVSPEGKKQQKKLHKEKEKTGGGGFRKLFGRKNRQSKLPDNAASQLQSMGVHEQPAAVPVSVPEQVQAAPAARPGGLSREPTEFVTPHEQPADILGAEPVASHEPTYEPSVEETISRVATADALEAKDEFSRFDQGPLLEQPAFIPDDSPEEVADHSDVDDDDDDAVPPPIARHPSQSPVSSPRLDGSADGDMTPTGAPQDRWAQIRKNAAERAAARAADEAKQAGGGARRNTDGDGDTSGEETIESRVARIKARVAELTNNMETTSPGNWAPPPPFRR